MGVKRDMMNVFTKSESAQLGGEHLPQFPHPVMLQTLGPHSLPLSDNKQELKKPEFIKDIKDVEVKEGQSVKFRCKVKGYPQPRVIWYKDGKLLKNSKFCRLGKNIISLQIVSKVKGIILEICLLTEKDSMVLLFCFQKNSGTVTTF